MVKKRKFGIGTLGCLSVIVAALIPALGAYILELLPLPVETEGMVGLGMACSIIILVGAGIIMMIIGLIRYIRSKNETAEAERLVRIARKAEQIMVEDELRDEE